jgi:hypothetical protein
MLTKEQINTLFTFCEKHSVRHYDVQVELVDHLANAIEDRMQADKDLSFEAALKKVYDDFGVMGFGRMVSSRSLALETQYSRQRNKLFLSYFSWPKIGMTALVISVLIVTAQYFSGPVRFYVTGCIQVAVFLYEMFSVGYAFRLRGAQSRKLVITDAVIGLPLVAGFFFSFALVQTAVFFHDIDYCTPLRYVMWNISWLLYFVITKGYLQTVRKVFSTAATQFPAAFAKR